MAIYTWHGREKETLINEVHTRRTGNDSFDAVIMPPNKDDPEAVAELVKALTRQGYELSPFELKQDEQHTLTISASPSQLAKMEKGLARTWMGERGKMSLKGETLTISGLTHQVDVDAVMRWANSHSYTEKKGVTFKHTHEQKNPTHGLYVKGVKDEQALLEVVEKHGAKGERQDEYYGMSPVAKLWAKAARSAKKYSSGLYMLAEAQVLVSVLTNSARTGQNPLLNPEIREPIGYLSGSSGMFLGALLAETPGTEEVVERFKDNFKVGDGYDFEGKSDHFSSNGISWGRGPDRIKDFFRDNGTEFLMLMNTYAATGLLSGQYNNIFSTQVDAKDGTQNVVVSTVNDDKEMDKRFQPKNLISGVLLGAFTLLYTFLPRDGNRNPTVRWDSFYDKALDTPVLGNAIRFAVGLGDTTVGRFVTYIPNKLINAIRKEPEHISGRFFQAHNVNQITLGALDVLKVQKELAQLEPQFAKEKEMLDNGTLTAPYGKEGFTAGFTLNDVKEQLSAVYDLADDKSYKLIWENYEEKLSRNEKPTDKERYVATKALNRIFLDQLHQEVRQFKWKLSGNANSMLAGFFMAHTGDTHNKVNQAAATISGFAVAQGIVEELRKEGQVSDKSLHNAALYMTQELALKHHGYGVKEFESILNAYAEGREPEQVKQQLGVWQPVAETAAKHTTEGKENLPDVALNMRTKSENLAPSAV